MQTNKHIDTDGLSQWNPTQYDAPSCDTPIWDTVQRIMALIAVILALPLFAILYVLVRATSKGPFLYSQQRPGLNGKMFSALKVRTMRTGADKDKSRARKVDQDDPMITPIGKILRELKLDELPQLINVIKGEMALVGPRPIAASLQAELEQKIPGFGRRLQIKPGLSSLGQVCLFDNGESVVDDWAMRFEGELHYLYYRSWKYDLIIMAMTVLFLMRKIWNRIKGKRKLLLLPVAGMLLMLTTACSESLSTRTFVEADAAYKKDVRAFGSRQDPTIASVEPISIPVEAEVYQDAEYRVGAGDVIAVNVFGEEGLDDLRVSVDGAGYIQIPFIERMKVSDKTVAEIQAELKTGFGQFFLNPWVVVQVANYRSRPVYLLGEFNKPGVVYLDGPTNLMQAVSMGSGLSDLAHLRGARLWRNDQIAAVDLHALLMKGKAEHNIGLMPGDTIFVPNQADNKAYVLGAVVRAGAVPFANEPMTLLKALTHVGGPDRPSALMSQVRIIRTHSPVDGQLILVNAKDILKGRAPDLELMPDDIVYVPNNWVENWNQVVRAITPTLQLAGGVLQPVVQIKFLTGD